MRAETPEKREIPFISYFHLSASFIPIQSLVNA